MARVYKQKARKDIYARGLRTKADNKQGYKLDSSQPADEKDYVVIPKGSLYYSWTLYGRPTQISLTPPTRQQLTGSGFLCSVYDLDDRIQALSTENFSTTDELQSEVEDIVQEINNLADEQDDKRNSMPEQLQDAPTGELLQNRYDELQSWANELEGVTIEEPEDLEKEEGESEEDFETRKKEALTEKLNEIISDLQNCSYNGE